MTTGKDLVHARYLVDVRPNTDPDTVRRDIWQRYGDEHAPSSQHMTVNWCKTTCGGGVSLIVDYVACGANGNDITRRIGSAAGVARSQLTVHPMWKMNYDAPALLLPTFEEIEQRAAGLHVSVNLII